MSRQSLYRNIIKGGLIGVFLLISCILETNYTWSEEVWLPEIVIGQPDMDIKTSGCSSTQLYNPTSVYYDGARLHVVDSVNNRVLIYNNIPTTNGAPADVVVGQENFDSNSPGCSATQLRNISGVCSDGVRLYIADTRNNRILIYNTIPTSNGTAADIVVGQTDMETNSSGCSSTKLSVPESVFSDGNRLYIADSGNNRILVYNTIPTADGIEADVVVGQTNMNSNSSGCSSTELMTPSGVCSDGQKLYVVDNSSLTDPILCAIWNNRLLIYDYIPSENGMAANVVIGHQTMDEGPSGSPYGPASIYSDGNRLYIGWLENLGDSIIYVYNSIPSCNGVSPDLIVGEGDMKNSLEIKDLFELNGPRGIVSDGSKLYITNTENHRVLVYKKYGSSTALRESKLTLINNLFNPTRAERVTIKYIIDEAAEVKINIYNIIGELIRTYDLGYKSAGRYVDLTWDGKNDSGETVASGIYLVYIEAGGYRETKKCAVIK